jgi:hypothetical protein
MNQEPGNALQRPQRASGDQFARAIGRGSQRAEEHQKAIAKKGSLLRL